jgi:hypothetical protein
MKIPRELVFHPANTPAAVRAVELAESNATLSEGLSRRHEAHLRAVYARLYPDHQGPFAVLRRIRARRGLK